MTHPRFEGHHPTAILTETGWLTACTSCGVDGCFTSEKRGTYEQARDRAADQLAEAGHGLGWSA